MEEELNNTIKEVSNELRKRCEMKEDHGVMQAKGFTIEKVAGYKTLQKLARLGKVEIKPKHP